MSTRTVLVTGVCGGIGQATAAAFAEEGWFVAGVDVGGPAPAIVDDFAQLDLADAAAVEAYAQTLPDRLPDPASGLHALVNNAAVQLCKPLQETEVAEWDHVLDVNLRAVYLLHRFLHPIMHREGAAIVNVSSVHATSTSKNIGAYAASKGGLSALTRAMALELADQNVRVNAVSPGAVDTSMLRSGLTRGHVEGEEDESRVRALAEKHPGGKIGQPEEIAQVILFLADGNRSSFMTGESVVADGGATIQLSTE